MKIFRYSDSDISKLSEIVQNGGVIVYPTDTVYGIGCNPFNKQAIEKIFSIKKRQNKPLPVLCQSIDYARKLVDFDELLNKLAIKFWPGPLTIVAPIKNHDLPKLLTLNSDFLGIRVPNNPITLNLISDCGGYLVGTSANISGKKSHSNYSEIISELHDFDAILANDFIGKLESTVIQIKDGNLIILREGSITLTQLENIK